MMATVNGRLGRSKRKVMMTHTLLGLRLFLGTVEYSGKKYARWKMDKEEAYKVLDIMKDADTSCPTCAISLMKKFVRFFGYEDVAKKIFFEKFSWKTEDYWND